MKNQGNVAREYWVGADALSRTQPDCRSSLLHWVTRQDVLDLQAALRLGWVPPDFETKLRELAAGGLVEQQIERNCRLLIALLTAVCNGSFKEISRAECDRLLTVLAYVRKTDDAIPDYLKNGFADDQQELHAAAVQFASVLQGYKAWRLRHQVPAMWRGHN